MSTPSEFTEALARLDAEITAAEAHLAELRFKRTGAEAFLAYMNHAPRQQPPASTDNSRGRQPKRTASPATGAGPTDAVWNIFTPGVIITIDDAHRTVNARGHKMTREQTRNALHYLVRKQLIEPVGRGAWRLRDAESPAPAGDSGGITQEGGDSHEETASSAASAAEHQFHAQLGASIAEVAI